MVLDLIKKFKIEVLQEWSSRLGLTGPDDEFALSQQSSAARAAHRELCSPLRFFGPVISAGFARVRLGAWRDIAPYKQGGRARLSQV